MKNFLAEFTGTFSLVFCGTGAMIINEETNGIITHPGVAITWGLIVIVMIYSFGKISGAHINPAVTIGLFIAGLFEAKKIPAYISAQILGGVTASMLLTFLFPANDFLGATIPAGTKMQSFILEIILGFFLMTVILFTSRNKEAFSFAGIAIGFTVLLEAMFAGPVTGASMNPARSLAPDLIRGDFSFTWIYIIAPLTGCCIAALFWKYMDKETETVKLK